MSFSVGTFEVTPNSLVYNGLNSPVLGTIHLVLSYSDDGDGLAGTPVDFRVENSAGGAYSGFVQVSDQAFYTGEIVVVGTWESSGLGSDGFYSEAHDTVTWDDNGGTGAGALDGGIEVNSLDVVVYDGDNSFGSGTEYFRQTFIGAFLFIGAPKLAASRMGLKIGVGL
jgi:hypothetical protein